MDQKRTVAVMLVLASMMAALLSPRAHGQYAPEPSLADQREGSLSVSFQNYYNRINGSTAYNVQGGAVRFRHFYPKRGLLSVQFEPLLSKGSLGFGDNYLSLTGVPWKGRHWDLFGGEFRTETALVENPFANYQLPQLGIRGGRVIARTGKWTASAFAGVESLAQGSRISFRKTVPQSAFGGQLSGSLNENVQLSFRVLQLLTSNDQSERTAAFFPLGRRVISSTSATTQASVKVNQKLRIYGEASVNRSRMAEGSSAQPANISWVAGPAYSTDRFKVRGNYVRQGFGYLPAAGYYLGDRKGPSVDGSVQFGRVGFSGNWLQSSNNIERDTNVPDFFSRQGGGNVYVHLPLGFSVSGSLNQIGLRSISPKQETTQETTHHSHRQYLGSLSRPVYRHSLRVSWMRTEQRMHGTNQQVTSWEVEDSYSWRGLSGSGAVRLQRVAGDESKESYFTRASLQWGHGKLNLYGNWEQGKDLANDSLFTTNVASTSVLGMTWEAPSGVGIRFEGFRTQSNTLLNPQNLFLLNTRGLVPATVLNQSNDWNIYMRVSRELGWGNSAFNGMPGNLSAQAPLLGAVAGFVKLRTMEGDLPAANVWIIADTGVRSKTDATGYFAFPEIFQGKRVLTLDQDRLPADFSPLDPTELVVEVKADQTARAELAVEPLVNLAGEVRDQNGAPAPEGVVLGLENGKHQTTTDALGRFGFFSLPEGEYVVEVISATLPDQTPISYPVPARISLRYATKPPLATVNISVAFEAPKPIKEINLQAKATTVKVKAPVSKVVKKLPAPRTPVKASAKPTASAKAKTSVKAKTKAGRVISSTGPISAGLISAGPRRTSIVSTN